MRPPAVQSAVKAIPLCPACQNSLVFHRRRAVRSYATTSAASSRPLKLAIIGAGPSGFYAASRILSLLPNDDPTGQNVRIDMYERLPTPYGLVRYGVAPDHPEVKNCQHKFDALAADPRFRFFGNVSIGTQPSSSSTSFTSFTSSAHSSPPTALSPYTYPHALHLPLSSLLPHYTSVLFTYGASLSNPLSSVPGSSSSPGSALAGVHPALALVGWYNGHPAFSHLSSALRTDLAAASSVAVVGQGNVALDVARILLKPLAELEKTDMPGSVLDVLGESRVRSVSVVGRRGPAQVAFTTKEFREMLKLPGVGYAGLAEQMGKAELDEAREMVVGDRPRTRLLGLMEKSNAVSGDKEFKLEFLRSPKAFLPSAPSASSATDGPAQVAEVEWTVNQLLVPPPPPPSPPTSQEGSVPAPRGGGAVARPTGETARTKAEMVVESVGYRSEPLGLEAEGGWDMPFDTARGRVRNVDGRLVDTEGLAIPGLYAAGWAARGPVGVIASTMHDAYTLAEAIINDQLVHPLPATSAGGAPDLGRALGPGEDHGPPAEIRRGLKQGTVVDMQAWQRIDRAEVQRAQRAGKGKEREKFTTVEDMLAVLH